jgi:cob(I)alamin adenosyltransferase
MGNRLSRIYTRTGDDGGHHLMSQSRASCAGCSGTLPAWPSR